MIIDTAQPVNVVTAFGLQWPDAFRLRGSVIRLAFPGVLLMTGYGVGIAFLINKYSYLSINLTVMSLISLVLSLLLVFRTNSAYDRFWEGRKLWQDIKVFSRNIIRTCWCCVMEKSIEDAVQKRQALKNVAAFVISVKHYLRGEDGIDYADYDGLLSPEFRLAYSTRGAAYNYGSISGIGGSSPLRGADSSTILQAQQAKEGWERADDIPLPMQLLYELQKYSELIQDNHLIHLPYYTILITYITTLGTLLGGCERIISTPIPLAYRIHLQHALYLYLLVLPWALGSMGLAKTIIIQFVISFMMIGIDAISREIQNPFGYDSNDLPLDAYCDTILVELNYALNHRSPKSLETVENTLSEHSAGTDAK